jgi:hypothetical protein
MVRRTEALLPSRWPYPNQAIAPSLPSSLPTLPLPLPLSHLPFPLSPLPFPLSPLPSPLSPLPSPLSPSSSPSLQSLRSLPSSLPPSLYSGSETPKLSEVTLKAVSVLQAILTSPHNSVTRKKENQKFQELNLVPCGDLIRVSPCDGLLGDRIEINKI